MSRCGLQTAVSFHRLWYAPGDIVRATVYVESVPELFTEGEKAITFPYQPLYNYFDVDDSDDENDGRTEINIKSISCRIKTSGYCNTARVEPPAWMENRTEAGTTTSETNSMLEFTIFQSAVNTISENVTLSRHQCKAFNCIFKLPDNIPPSLCCFNTAFVGTNLEITTDWDTVYKSKQPKRVPVMQPFAIVLFSSQASVTPFFLSTCETVSSEKEAPTRGEDRLGFRVVAISAAPTSTLAAPLQNTVSPQETQVRSTELLHSSAQQRIHDSICDRRTPFEYTLRHQGGSDAPLAHLCIDSVQVSLGDHLSGVVVLPSAPKDAAAEHPRLVKMALSLEMMECCSEEASNVAEAVAVVGMAHTTALSVRVKGTQEICTLDTPLIPFSISLHDNYTPTILTDVVSVMWQLRLKFFVAKRIHVGQHALMDGEVPELVVPLTVVPPRIPERPRCSPTWKYF